MGKCKKEHLPPKTVSQLSAYHWLSDFNNFYFGQLLLTSQLTVREKVIPLMCQCIQHF